jgi:ferredoxin
MAHRLHVLGRAFDLHYSAGSRDSCGFAAEIAAAPWAGRAHFHFSQEGGRADLAAAMPAWRDGMKLYTCGSDHYMDAVYAAARARGWPEAALSREYFTTPEPPDYVNHPFVLDLLRSGRRLKVPADRSATDVLQEAGIPVLTKCSDGICGVCATAHSGEVEIVHRDYVLSAAEREHKVILCCSRPAALGAALRVDL